MSQAPVIFSFHDIPLTEDSIDRGFSEKELDALDFMTETASEEFSSTLLEKLQILSLSYPHIPNFHHAIARFYLLGGKPEAADREIDLLLAKFPNYLHGRTLKAMLLSASNRLSEALALLGESLSLADLYPERAYFQVSEYLVYYQAVVYYLCAQKEWEAAEKQVARMIELDPEDQLTEDVIDRLNRGMKLNDLQELHAKFAEETEKVVHKPTSSVPERSLPEQREAPPKLNHPELMALYENDLTINQDLLRVILSLPRQSLIRDLEEVLKDSMYRYEHFLDLCENAQIDEKKLTSFPLHALFLLKELQAKESLPVVLECLGAPEEAIEFWYGDFLTEAMWTILYQVGQHDLPALFAFFHQEDVYEFSRLLPLRVAQVVGVIQAERKPELLQVFTSSVETFRTTLGDEAWGDSFLRIELLSAAADLQLTELTEIGLELFSGGKDPDSNGENKVWFQKRMEGKGEPDIQSRDLVDLRATIFETYDNITQTWYGYNQSSEPERTLSLPKSFPPLTPTPALRPVPQRSARKVGRNEPCPCGSGKKYKKCCLNT